MPTSAICARRNFGSVRVNDRPPSAQVSSAPLGSVRDLRSAVPICLARALPWISVDRTERGLIRKICIKAEPFNPLVHFGALLTAGWANLFGSPNNLEKPVDG